MRRSYVVLALLGSVACESETSLQSGSWGSSSTGGGAGASSTQGGSSPATTLPATGGAAALGGSDQGGANATSAPIVGGSAGAGIDGLAGAGIAGAGIAGSGAAGSNAGFDCGLPVPTTTGVAKPSGTPGNLKVLNWAGFKSAVTYSFDDGHSTQIDHYAELNALGVRFTFYLVTSWASATNPIWAQAVKDGHELGNHTQTHQATATAEDIDAGAAFIKTHYGVTPLTMAQPYGNESYVAPSEGKYLINRAVFSSSILPNGYDDPHNLPSTMPAAEAPASDLNAMVDAARRDGAWLVFTIHGFTGGESAYQAINFSDFTANVNYGKSVGDIWLDNMVNVGAYWVAQKALSGVTATTSGGDRTYTWTLPTPFPTGKCLRVSVDGGTVKQNGKVLNWDSHGYYEISLDAGSVTISP